MAKIHQKGGVTNADSIIIFGILIILFSIIWLVVFTTQYINSFVFEHPFFVLWVIPANFWTLLIALPIFALGCWITDTGINLDEQIDKR